MWCGRLCAWVAGMAGWEVEACGVHRAQQTCLLGPADSPLLTTGRALLASWATLVDDLEPKIHMLANVDAGVSERTRAASAGGSAQLCAIGSTGDNCASRPSPRRR